MLLLQRFLWKLILRSDTNVDKIGYEKALEAIYVCYFGKEPIEDEDERLLNTILTAVFPSVKQPEIERIVKGKAKKVSEGSGEINVLESKLLPKEAVQQQMKDPQFLKQNSET